MAYIWKVTDNVLKIKLQIQSGSVCLEDYCVFLVRSHRL